MFKTGTTLPVEAFEFSGSAEDSLNSLKWNANDIAKNK